MRILEGDLFRAHAQLVPTRYPADSESGPSNLRTPPRNLGVMVDQASDFDTRRHMSSIPRPPRSGHMQAYSNCLLNSANCRLKSATSATRRSTLACRRATMSSRVSRTLGVCPAGDGADAAG